MKTGVKNLFDQPRGVCYHKYAPKTIRFCSEVLGSFAVRFSSDIAHTRTDSEIPPFYWLSSRASDSYWSAYQKKQ
jgi:hypothetical protein